MRHCVSFSVLLTAFVLVAFADDPPEQPKVKIIGGGELPKNAKIVQLDGGLDKGKVTEPELRKEILAMVQEDQKGRREMVALHTKLHEKEDPELRQQLNAIGEK